MTKAQARAFLQKNREDYDRKLGILLKAHKAKVADLEKAYLVNSRRLWNTSLKREAKYIEVLR